jgi:hypothetical protein
MFWACEAMAFSENANESDAPMPIARTIEEVVSEAMRRSSMR